MKKIKVFIVEDSLVARELLSYILNSHPDIEVIGYAESGEKALTRLEGVKPDLITMDINMPGLSGYETTKLILEKHPIPIIVISAILDPKNMKSTYQALQAGALAVVEKPYGFGHAEFANCSEKIIDTVKMMSEIKVITRKPSFTPTQIIRRKTFSNKNRKIDIIVIGVSTGGPTIIQKIIEGLKPDFNIPILITQHISEGFAESFVNWLNDTSKIPIQIPKQDELIMPGNIYVAPAEKSMTVNFNRKISLLDRVHENDLVPNVGKMFSSVDMVYKENCVGILLTGMGKDGALELDMMAQNGSVTIAQNEESCIVYGMPKVAIDMGNVKHIMNPDEIIEYLNKL